MSRTPFHRFWKPTLPQNSNTLEERKPYPFGIVGCAGRRLSLDGTDISKGCECPSCGKLPVDHANHGLVLPSGRVSVDSTVSVAIPSLCSLAMSMSPSTEQHCLSWVSCAAFCLLSLLKNSSGTLLGLIDVQLAESSSHAAHLSEGVQVLLYFPQRIPRCTVRPSNSSSRKVSGSYQPIAFLAQLNGKSMVLVGTGKCLAKYPPN